MDAEKFEEMWLKTNQKLDMISRNLCDIANALEKKEKKQTFFFKFLNLYNMCAEKKLSENDFLKLMGYGDPMECSRRMYLVSLVHAANNELAKDMGGKFVLVLKKEGRKEQQWIKWVPDEPYE